MSNILFLIAGKSGSGKTTAAENAAKYFGWKMCESYTTRPPRKENEKGHIFISEDEFLSLPLIESNIFNGYRYGTTEELLRPCNIHVVDMNGIKAFSEIKSRPIRTIYIDISEEETRRRMLSRGDTESAVEARITHDSEAFASACNYPFDLIIDGSSSKETVCDELIKYIMKEDEYYENK